MPAQLVSRVSRTLRFDVHAAGIVLQDIRNLCGACGLDMIIAWVLHMCAASSIKVRATCVEHVLPRLQVCAGYSPTESPTHANITTILNM